MLTTGGHPGRPGLGEISVLLADPDRGTLPGALLRTIRELAAGAGVTTLLSEAVAGGPQHRLHLEQGFTQYGRLPAAPGGADTVLLRRDLAGGVEEAAPAGDVLVELSHPITDGMITYPGIPAPRLGSHLSFEESAAHYAPGTEFSIGTIALAANTGTYLDTPAHRYRGGADLAGMPLARLANLPGLVVEPTPGDGGTISRLDVDDGLIAGRAVLVRTGHAAHWGSDRYFRDHPHLGIDAVSRLIDAGAALVGHRLAEHRRHLDRGAARAHRAARRRHSDRRTPDQPRRPAGHRFPILRHAAAGRGDGHVPGPGVRDRRRRGRNRLTPAGMAGSDRKDRR